MTRERIAVAAVSIAADMVAAARGSDEPVVFVTGNSMMPPLRWYPQAEAIWQDDEDGEAFNALHEAVEALLDAAHVCLECPDYDNALYVVDLARWEHIEDSDADTLSGEWKAVDG